VLRRLRPILLLEISLDHEEIADLLEQAGYVLNSPLGAVAPVVPGVRANYFALHRSEHSRLLEALGLRGQAPSEEAGALRHPPAMSAG
jgi:hypothetical protein